MTNTFKKSFLILAACFLASTLWAEDATFTMASIFDGSNLSVSVSSPVEATVSTTTSKSNSKTGKLGSDGNYFQIVLESRTFSAASINGFINTGTIEGKNWGFQFSTDKGASWSTEVSQPNDGNKNAHDITVSVTIPANANGFRVLRRAGTATQVNSITLSLNSAGPAGPVAVTGVALNKTATSIEAGQSEQLTATVQPANADDPSVTWSSSNTAVATVDQNGNVSAIAAGTTTITVTTTDGNKTASCAVTVTAPPTPKDVTGIGLSETTATVYVGATKSLTVNYTPADANQGLGITWTSSNENIATVADGVVTGVAVGTATITATSAGGFSATCAVTVEVKHPTDVTLDKSTLNVQIGGTAALTATVQPSDATNKNVTWESSNTAIATVTNGQVKGIAEGTATITVKTVDGNKTATCTVSVTAGDPVPENDLTIHVPEKYELSKLAGGYGGTLSIFNSREYEVYYASYDSSNNLSVTVAPERKRIGIVTTTGLSCRAKDGWFKMTAGDSKSDFSMPDIDEFKSGSTATHKLKDGSSYLIHVKGYDQFSFYGKENSSNGKNFEVYINGKKQNMTKSTSATIRRFDIPTSEILIEVKGIGSSNEEFYGFSLRLAQEPRTKRVKGNDSTQVVNQTASITPITYATKYNNIPNAETRLIWDGPEAKGISLPEEPLHGGLSDTLILSGQANCQIGEYKYHIAAYYNGVEINRVSGKFIVKSSIAARSELDALAYTGEEMDQIIFSYYALSPDSVRLNWPNGQPAGISGSGNNGRYIIGGTPTATSGTYPYSITTAGGDTTFTGTISVITPNYGPKSVMYLCKNAKDYSKDAIYQALNGTGSNQWDLFPRKQKENGPRPTEQYANYKWILISEDADADNLEVLSIIQGGANLPVLSMKGFTYAQGRLGWGEPNNGAIDTTLNTKNKGTKLYIEQPSHPIFAQLGSSLKKGDSIQILSNYELNGIMPVDVKLPGTYCLATAYTRDINDYYKNGELQTALHEVPANMRGGQKYICLPLAKGVTFTPQGKNLLNGIISYLLSPDQATVETPELQINSFELLGVKATINQSENTISLALTEEQSAQLEGAEPTIKIADEANTHVTTSAVPLQYALYTPKIYVVTDYINRRAYSLTIDVYDPEGIENVYEAGEWVNIYDIYGRKVATTNENIYTMDLPRGMYIIVTESGETLKIMR